MRGRVRYVVDRYPQWIVVGLFAYLTLIGFIAVFTVIRSYQIASETHRSACSLKADYRSRIASAQAFLVKHPQGIAGVSRGDIERSIRNEQRTLYSFRFLDC